MVNSWSDLISLLNESIYSHALKEQLKYVYITGIDNILNKVADPFLIGQTISSKVDLAFKYVHKAYPSENVGLHVIQSDGKYGVMG